MKSKKATNGVCTAREYQDLLFKLKQLATDKRETTKENELLRHKVNQLESEKLELARRVDSLKSQNKDFRKRNQELVLEVLDAQERDRIREEATVVGFDVRRRFLEKHRQRMAKLKGAEEGWTIEDLKLKRFGDLVVEMGNRAAHRGEPLADAWVVRSDQTYWAAFEDLYGISPERLERWEEIRELRRVVGMRGTLRNEGVECPQFEKTFRELLHLEASYDVDVLDVEFDRNPAFLKYVKILEVLFQALEDEGKIRTKLFY